MSWQILVDTYLNSQVLSHYKGYTQLMTKFLSFSGVYSKIYSLKVKKLFFFVQIAI